MTRRSGQLAQALLPSLVAACAAGTPTCPDQDCSDAGLAPAAPVTPRIVGEERACAMQESAAVPGLESQVDVVLVIDNSGSMQDEIEAVRRHINESFADLLRQSGVDYRVLLVTQYGVGGTRVCVEPPLAGAPCSAGLVAALHERFFHYDVVVDSFDPWCRLLTALDTPDPTGFAPHGLRQWLRADAKRVIVVITDDSAQCIYEHRGRQIFLGSDDDPFAAALRFHQVLLELLGVDPMPGAPAPYSFFSIVGLQEGQVATEPLFPHEALEPFTCNTAPSPGLAYQALSVITDALRYPVCEGRGFDAVFRVLARNVLDAAKADCVFELPAPPEGQSLERSTVRVEYRPGGDGEPVLFTQVEGRDACSARSFYLTEDRIVLCPTTCNAVEADSSAALRVLYGCAVVPE
jgi:hypothetical protein